MSYCVSEDDFKKFRDAVDDAINSERARSSAGRRAHDDIVKVANEIVSSGMKTLAQTRHPDYGGSQDDMQLLNLATRWLRQMIERPALDACLKVKK